MTQCAAIEERVSDAVKSYQSGFNPPNLRHPRTILCFSHGWLKLEGTPETPVFDGNHPGLREYAPSSATPWAMLSRTG
jgi:hypothetical protein